MPAIVASHFAADGSANGWMTRGAYGWFAFGFSVLFPLGIAVLVTGLIRLSAGSINLPNRNYWFAPERREESLAFLDAHVCWVGSLISILGACVHYMVLEANSAVPPRLPNVSFLGMLAVFIVALAIWIAALHRRFRKVE